MKKGKFKVKFPDKKRKSKFKICFLFDGKVYLLKKLPKNSSGFTFDCEQDAIDFYLDMQNNRKANKTLTFKK